MPSFNAQIKGFDYKTLCAMHRCGVQVLRNGNSRCIVGEQSCGPWWYIEGTYREFIFPEDEDHGLPPAG